MSLPEPATLFTRLISLWGEEEFVRVQKSRILVVGVGAVGSAAVEVLARSGVGTLVLVDGDVVDPSNINRQLVALTSTIGKLKVDIAKHRVIDINPSCVVETQSRFIGPEDCEQLLREARPDVIVDAIDSIRSKVALIATAVRAGIPIATSMGAARHQDPLMIRRAPIHKTTVCPLAKAVRQRLRLEYRLGGSLPDTCAVFSTEPAAKPAADGTAPLPSFSAVTMCFGATLAGAALARARTGAFGAARRV